MKGRDLLILAAVLLVIGFAVADSLRSDETSVEPSPDDHGGGGARADHDRVRRRTTSGGSSSRGPRGPGLDRAGRRPGSCAVREFDLPTGLELPNVVQASTCQLWAAPVTWKVAVGIGEPVGDAVPFRFVDLGRPNRDLGNSEAAFGFLVWSEDGQRAAWCNGRLEGIDLELDGTRRRLPDCPAAYAPNGEVAFARGSRLVTEEQELLQASGRDHAASTSAATTPWPSSSRGGGSSGTSKGGSPTRSTSRSDSRAGRPSSRLTTARRPSRPEAAPASWTWAARRTAAGATRATSPRGPRTAPGSRVGGADEVTFVNLPTGETVEWPIGAAELIWRRT